MRILHVNKYLYRRGGAEAYLLELAELQRSLGHDVAFFGMKHRLNEPMRYQEHFPSYVQFEPPPAGARDRLRLAARMLWSREAAAGMAEVIEQFRPDVVHLHNVYHQLSPSVLAPVARRGVPAVMTLHDYKLACPTYQLLDSNPAGGPPRPCTACVTGGVRQAALRACRSGSTSASAAAAVELGLHRRFGAYDAVGSFICPSRFMMRTMVGAGVYPERMRVLDNFTTQHAATRSGPGDDLVYFGRLSHEKGVDTLLDAFRIVAGSLGSAAPTLHIAGEGPSSDDLRRQAATIAGDVKFHGRIGKPEIDGLLSKARTSVVPSRWHENQPLSVLESLAAGVPVVATDMGGLPEVIRHGVNGLIVQPDSATSLAGALLAYLAQPEVAQRHGNAAQQESRTRFDPARHVDQVLQIYRCADRGRFGNAILELT